MSRVKVDLGKDSYEIIIGDKLLDSTGELVRKVVPNNATLFVVSDKNIPKIYSKTLLTSLEKSGFECHRIVIEAGEKSKSFKNLQYVLDSIFEHKPERNSCLIALGGGVVGDLTGFVASILLRGVNFIQIPTSLLAMVDSSVGGKTGINVKYGKNLVGSFYQPEIVIADINLLKTLPKREILAGFAEIVKYGLIDDVNFFEYIENQRDLSNLSYMIEKSCQAKARIVTEDEKESGKRALLNLGHTFGHALETLAKYNGTLLHGEAVAIGMIQAFRFSEYIGICKIGCADRLEKLFRKFGMKTKASEIGIKLSARKILNLMYQDKKVSNKKLTFILATDIGKSFIKKDVDGKQVLDFLKRDLL